MMKSLIQTHCYTSASEFKRRSADERMKQLGIEDQDYEKYEEMFLTSRERNHHIRKTQDGWVEIKHPWNKNLVLAHLSGEKTIGLFPARQLNYLMFDLDRHRAEDEISLKPRMDAVMGVVDGDPLAYQSSFSGGVRLCFFLSEFMDRDQLHLRYKRLFQDKGVPLKPGFIEILAGRKGDRLPFGEGSYVIDPFTLEPIYHLTLRETIGEAYEVFQYQKLEIPFDIKTTDQTLVLNAEHNSVFDLIVGRLYEYGLYPEITTNEALLKLSWDLIVRKGYSKEETEEFLTNWIFRKHNGLSNRFNAGKVLDIIEHIKRIVRKSNPSLAKYPVSRYALRERKLSLNDVRKIVLLTDDSKLRLALFSLLEYCLCFGKRSKEGRRKKEKISNIYGAQKSHVTYGAGFQENFYCEISKKTLRHLPGFDKANPQITMQKIEELGVVSLKREAHPKSHHCRQYWIYFAFDEENSVKVVSLDQALTKLNVVDKIKVFSF